MADPSGSGRNNHSKAIVHRRAKINLRFWSSGELLATIQTDTATYHLRDHLSVRVSTGPTGWKIGEQGHYPYGESWYSSGTTTKWQFTNYERDSESGNDYAIARSYVNRLGRFYSPDPVDGNPASPQTLGLYAYVTDEPIDFTDPDGRLESPTCGSGGRDPGNPFGTPPFFPGGGFPWPIWWPGGGGSVGPTPPFFPTSGDGGGVGGATSDPRHLFGITVEHFLCTSLHAHPIFSVCEYICESEDDTGAIGTYRATQAALIKQCGPVAVLGCPTVIHRADTILWVLGVGIPISRNIVGCLP